MDLSSFYAARTAGESRPIPLASPVDLADLQTPALLIDQDALLRNLQKMQSYLTSKGKGLRAHAKMHKCPVIAKKQLALGAIGICAAKLSEAEVMAASGVQKLLLTSPLVSDDQIQRLLRLLKKAEIQIVVDQADFASRLQAALAAAGRRLGVLIDLDPKMGRTGVACGKPALVLARHLRDTCPNLHLEGLQFYAGHCMHIRGYVERRSRYLELLQLGMQTRDSLCGEGFDIQVFSGGGTGTYNIDAEVADGLTDLQVGSYALMDEEYGITGGPGRDRFDDFEQALFVLVSAISQPGSRAITLDGGIKAFATDTVKPVPKDLEGVSFHWGGDEHGILALSNPSRPVAPGDRLMMVPPHCDPTMNLYDFCFPFRDGQVQEIWPITARGCSQ